MADNYSQLKAMLAITKGSLRAIFRSPQAVFFSLFFPMVLIVIFGALNGNRGISIDIAFDKATDTSNQLYYRLNANTSINVENADETELEDRLKKGRITALVNIIKNKGENPNPPYTIHLKTTSASQKDLPVLRSILKEIINSIDERIHPQQEKIAEVTVEEIPGRQYRMIDFYLPSMLGFSLIGSSVFGVAFLFFSLRETLVLKRMYSTPIRKTYIVLGESLGRVLFQLTTAVIIIVFGRYLYHFTLFNGWATFAELMFLSLLGLTVFMGFGFIVSNYAKNQNVIPIYANLFMFPQYFLSGTFFPKSLLPQGVQKVINYLPLTALNDSMRKVSFEGAGLGTVLPEMAILVAWGIILYAIAIRVFRWD